MKINHYIKGLGFAFLWVILACCVTNFDPKITENTPKLVVDGVITNQPGPYRVTVQYSYPYTNNTSVRSIAGAVVEISDDKGNKETLTERGQGLYETSPTGIRGIVGRSYKISIKAPDGRKYESKPELLKAVASIGVVSTEYQDTRSPNFRGQFSFFVDVKDPDTPNDFYRWKWTHYNDISYCQYINTTGGNGEAIRFRNKCCGDCWEISACNGCIILANDRLTNGKTISKIPLGKIPYTDITPYFIILEQYSLTAEAYQYWKMVDSQINNSGGIFDLPPATVIGNIISTTNSEEQVLGYFGASSVAIQPLRIARNNAPVLIYQLRQENWIDLIPCVACRESPYRTAKKPLGW
jgi:Domain of unknown function (DUF4249)